ncbi:hypothetical protein GCM10009780_28360 [Actinomadura alba]
MGVRSSIERLREGRLRRRRPGSINRAARPPDENLRYVFKDASCDTGRRAAVPGSASRARGLFRPVPQPGDGRPAQMGAPTRIRAVSCWTLARKVLDVSWRVEGRLPRDPLRRRERLTRTGTGLRGPGKP